MPVRPKFIWSHEYLNKLNDELGDECIVLCLSPVSFRMLIDMTAMLLWPTRYEDLPHDEISSYGKIAYQELNVPCSFNFDDVVTALGGINTTLAAIQAAIENQEISLDSVDLVTAITGVQLAIENQEIALDTGLLLPALTGIQTAIENQEMVCNCGSAGGSDDMGTVNVYCGCGCGSSGGGSGTPANPGDGVDETDETGPGGVPVEDYLPPLDETDFTNPDWQSNYSQEDVCALTHYMLMSWRNLILGVASGEIGASGVWNVINNMYWGLFTFTIAKPAVVQMILAAIGKLTGSSSVSTEIDRNYETLQCILLGQGSQETKVNNAYQIINSMALPFFTKLFMKSMLGVMPWGFIYAGTAASTAIANLPEWAYTRGCPSCVGNGGGEQGELTPPTGYKWIPASPTGFSVPILTPAFTHEGNGVFSKFYGATEQAEIRFAGNLEGAYAYSVQVIGHELTSYYQTSGHRLTPDGDYLFNVSKGMIANVLGAPIAVPDGWEMHGVTGALGKTYWRIYTGTLRVKVMMLVLNSYVNAAYP